MPYYLVKHKHVDRFNGKDLEWLVEAPNENYVQEAVIGTGASFERRNRLERTVDGGIMDRKTGDILELDLTLPDGKVILRDCCQTEVRETNDEVIARLMNFSKHGALMQAFIIDALTRAADFAAAQPPSRYDSGLISGTAWVNTAKELKAELDRHLERRT